MIKCDLFTRGYTYENFLVLDHKMESGSRQLLICLGWLIYQVKFIETCMENCLNSDSILDYDDTSSLYQVNQIVIILLYFCFSRFDFYYRQIKLKM